METAFILFVNFIVLVWVLVAIGRIWHHTRETARFTMQHYLLVMAEKDLRPGDWKLEDRWKQYRVAMQGEIKPHTTGGML